MFRNLILVSAALLSQPVMAEWTIFSKTDISDIYIEPLSLRKIDDLRRVWVMEDRRTIVPKSYLSSRSLHEYDCKEERVRVIQRENFSERKLSGSPLPSPDNPNAWLYAAPGTVAAQILNLVCSPDISKHL